RADQPRADHDDAPRRNVLTHAVTLLLFLTRADLARCRLPRRLEFRRVLFRSRAGRRHCAMSRRSAVAPRRYTCWTAERGRSVSTCAISRMTRGSDPGTAISDAHSSGTSWNPSLRAARAGNSAVRSGVVVKMTLMTSSVLSSLRAITSDTSSVVASRIWSRSSASTCVAPRTARTATAAPPPLAAGLQPHGLVQFSDLVHGQRAHRAGLQHAQPDRAELYSGQLLDGEPDLLQQPPHDVLASLVQGDLDQDPLADLVEHPETVGLRRAVVQRHARLQPPAEVARDRPVDLGQIRLGHAVAGVGEAVRQLSVVGEQDQ